jgi:hypothetical protein
MKSVAPELPIPYRVRLRVMRVAHPAVPTPLDARG